VALDPSGNVVASWRARELASGRAVGLALDSSAKAAYVATTGAIAKYIGP